MRKHLHRLCHLVGILVLGACGGGVSASSTDPAATPLLEPVNARSLALASQVSESPPSDDDDDLMAPADDAAEAAALRWSHATTEIYRDGYAVPFRVRLERQFEVSESGEAFMGWYRTHKTADGTMDGTAVNVSRYDDATQTWIADEVAVVPFPGAGGGFIHHLQMMALPHGDMLMLWDVVHAWNGRHVTAPQVYASRYSARRHRWGEPQRLDVTYGDGRYPAGWQPWKAYPAGRGRVLLLWENVDQLHANFYVADQGGRWFQTDPVGERIGYIRGAWSDSQVTFNERGTGVVRVGEKTLYFDASTHRWSVPDIMPTDAHHRLSRKQLEVDDKGNVFVVALRQEWAHWERFWADLYKWSAKTSHRERLASLESPPFTPRLHRRPGGVLVVWRGDFGRGPGVAAVNNRGRVVERVEMPGGTSDAWRNTVQDWDVDARGRITFVWRTYLDGLPRENSFSSVYRPGRGFSPALELDLPHVPQDAGVAESMSFKNNAQGKGAVFVRQFDNALRLPPGDHTAIQVYAKVLR